MSPLDDPEATHLATADLGRSLSVIGVGEETLQEPLRLKPFEHWVGHIPFAFWIVAALRPRVLVELGTHRGNSFLAFCQAIEAERCGTRAYAVDTWEGDAHMAREEGLFEELLAYHDPRYGHFSSLLRATFDEARELFPDKSIDLLHIDGTHTYEAVKKDFTDWEPALSDRAVVMFHDTNVRRPQYGVWKVWEELARERPHFEFFHSYGLGVLGVGRDLPQPLAALFALAPEGAAATRVRSYFAARGAVGVQRLAKEMEQERAAEAARQHWAQMAAHEARVAEAQAALAGERAQHAAALEAQRAGSEAALEALRAERAGSEAALEALRAERALNAAALEALRAERAGFEAARRQEREALLLRASESGALHAQAEANLQRVRAELEIANAEARRQIAEAAAAAQAAVGRLEQEKAETRALRASTSWRITGPLRSIAERMPARVRPGRRGAGRARAAGARSGARRSVVCRSGARPGWRRAGRSATKAYAGRNRA